MIIQIETSPGLGNIARWGPLPVSMVLRSEGFDLVLFLFTALQHILGHFGRGQLT